MKVVVIFYSAYGHIYKMAQAFAEGVKEVDGAQVELKRVAELLDQSMLEKLGIAEAQKAFSHIPLATLDDLEKADAIIIGTPTRFGNMCAQMRAFLDSTGSLWMKGTLVGSRQCFYLLGYPAWRAGNNDIEHPQYTPASWYGYRWLALYLSGTDEDGRNNRLIALWRSTIAGGHGERAPSANELAAARYQGRYVASIAAKLVK